MTDAGVRGARRAGWAGALVLLGGVACGDAAAPAPAPVAAVAPAPAIDDRAALALVKRFQCARCHDIPGVAPAPVLQHCVHCHQQIVAGTFAAAPTAPGDLARWRPHLTSLPVAPNLAAAARLRRAWVVDFLLRPVDVRPHLPATMPRLPITRAEATTLATFLVPVEHDGPPAVGDPARGAVLVVARGCPTCHAPAAAPPPGRPPDAFVLAPDLRRVAERVQPGVLIDWIVDPAHVVAGAAMPALGLNLDEARDIAAYLQASAGPVPPPPVPPRLPLLTREVSYDEIERRVFRKVCWHCHGAAHYAHGDGGPGNTGGLGFAARGLELASYAGVASGSLGADGRRRSVFAPMPDGTPRLVAHLLARQREEQGEVTEVRGMPLGLPSLAPADIQLVESWIAQGRPE